MIDGKRKQSPLELPFCRSPPPPYVKQLQPSAFRQLEPYRERRAVTRTCSRWYYLTLLFPSNPLLVAFLPALSLCTVSRAPGILAALQLRTHSARKLWGLREEGIEGRSGNSLRQSKAGRLTGAWGGGLTKDQNLVTHRSQVLQISVSAANTSTHK